MVPPDSGAEMSITTYKQTRRHIPEDTNIISTARTISNPVVDSKKSGYEQKEKTWKSFSRFQHGKPIFPE
jgi:hypothetical protein